MTHFDLFSGKTKSCKQCGKEFPLKIKQGNLQHCSSECARKSAIQSRKSFYKNKPEKLKEYRDKNPYSKLSKLERLYKKYPELSKVCEFCGEDRIVEIAHKPEHKRNGAWMIVGQTTPSKIWVLCPTCHNLLDKKGYTPQQLWKKH
jgi:hypothetical protein